MAEHLKHLLPAMVDKRYEASGPEVTNGQL